MSRLARYKDSLNRFIKENDYIKIQENVTKYDYIYPILFLTIMNSQSKKNDINVQGYHMATAVHILNILNDNMYSDAKTLILESNRAIMNNINNIKNFLDKSKSFDIFYFIMNLYNRFVNTEYILSYPKIETTDNKPNDEIQKWYLKKKNKKLNSKFKQVDRESYNSYLNTKVHPISEIAITAGWIAGGGSMDEIDKIKRMSKYFSMIYKFYRDFKELDNDLDNIENYKKNYIINFGLQESYELFMYNKHKLIKETMELEMYTYTLREIIDSIELVVDEVIDETSPDLKSNFSNAL